MNCILLVLLLFVTQAKTTYMLQQTLQASYRNIRGHSTSIKHTHHSMFICLVCQYRSTQYRHSPQHVYLLSMSIPQYLVQTTHHGFFFICLVPQYISTIVLSEDTHHSMFICLVLQCRSTWQGQLITACSSFVQCTSTFVLQFLVQTTCHSLFFICLVPQYVSTVVLGTDNSSRLVPHLFSALVCQYCSTWYGRFITACSSLLQCICTLVLYYLVRMTHHYLFFICLVR